MYGLFGVKLFGAKVVWCKQCLLYRSFLVPQVVGNCGAAFVWWLSCLVSKLFGAKRSDVRGVGCERCLVQKLHGVKGGWCQRFLGF